VAPHDLRKGIDVALLSQPHELDVGLLAGPHAKIVRS
jgi:hypothetical protein